uniref:Glucose-repressible alcohol dehydrogenase transcriptional effector-like n=1 Tax=Saccoglossus kowalevskii TaxID=10224 RepID=A0ABM0M495_SACKO
MTSNTPRWVEEPGVGLCYYARNCGLSEFPSEVFDESRRNVVWIWLNRNNISEIPENISCLRHLRSLLLYDNNLRTIPDNIGNLSQLEVLFLHGNPLIDLPVSLRRLKNLRYFSCDVIDGILEEDVRIMNNKTEIRKLFDKVFKRK